MTAGELIDWLAQYPRDVEVDPVLHVVTLKSPRRMVNNYTMGENGVELKKAPPRPLFYLSSLLSEEELLAIRENVMTCCIDQSKPHPQWTLFARHVLDEAQRRSGL